MSENWRLLGELSGTEGERQCVMCLCALLLVALCFKSAPDHRTRYVYMRLTHMLYADL